ncbi:hypothetical protein R3P38DRAFT_3113399 [Favolaschia claudopus]|uniref:FHA domain-containing protein n=1 Tax=Favolaschia claudopus TaxID=2862362 RepID=A0AAV9ZHZ0_9AGAR
MSGKYIHLAPPPEDELHQNGKPYAQFDPKTIYLVEGADPIILGRASSKSVSRSNEADNGYLKVPSGQTALGREHASLCLRNGVLYIAMKERDGLIFHDATHPRMLDRSSDGWGVNGAFSVTHLVDVIFDIADTDHWSSPVKKRFVSRSAAIIG